MSLGDRKLFCKVQTFNVEHNKLIFIPYSIFNILSWFRFLPLEFNSKLLMNNKKACNKLNSVGKKTQISKQKYFTFFCDATK